MSNPRKGVPTDVAPPPPSRARLLDRGDIVNLMGRLRRKLKESGRKITTAQNRLIMKRIEAAGITGDRSLVGPEQQIRQIARIAAEIVPMDGDRIEQELRACRG